jgi:hypothetical protein
MPKYVLFERKHNALVRDIDYINISLTGNIRYTDNMNPRVFDLSYLSMFAIELFHGVVALRYTEAELDEMPSCDYVWVTFKDKKKNKGMFKVYNSSYSRNEQTNNKNIIKNNKTVIINDLGSFNWSDFHICEF